MRAETSSVRVGVCPANFKFGGVLAPDGDGNLSRDTDGTIKILSGLKSLMENSPVALSVAPVFIFSGTKAEDIRETLNGIRELGLAPEIVLMVGGVDPMNTNDEDKWVELAVEILKIAKSVGIESISSPSFEEWMSPEETKKGADYDAAVKQLVKVHRRAYEEAGLANSSITLS